MHKQEEKGSGSVWRKTRTEEEQQSTYTDRCLARSSRADDHDLVRRGHEGEGEEKGTLELWRSRKSIRSLGEKERRQRIRSSPKETRKQ